MIMRLKTTSDVETKLSELDKKLKLSSKAAIMRIAIACSIKMEGDPRGKGDSFQHYDIKNQNGLDYQRLTIYGQMEDVYHLLMINKEGREVSDDEFFPELTFYHIERGVNFLYSEYLYADDRDKFFKKLVDL